MSDSQLTRRRREVLPKRVLYLAPSTGVGGAETFLISTARGHRDESVLPIYLLFQTGPLETALRASGAKVHVLPHRVRLSRPRLYLKTIQSIRRLIRQERVDVVHSTMAYGALFGAVAAGLEGVPHVWFQHGPVSGWMDSLAGGLPSRAMVANSRFTLERQRAVERFARAWLNRRRQDRIVYIGIDEARASPENRLTKDDRIFTAGLFCRMQEWKGPELFARAIAEAQTLCQRPIRGFLYSEATPGDIEQEKLRDRLKTWVSQSQAPVEFMGFTDRPLEAMAGLDVVVNASLTPEPLGLTILEAMASGTPPLAAAHGGPLEVIEDGIDGQFFKPGSVTDLARKLAWLAENPEACRRLGAAARLSFERRFRSDRTLAELERLYAAL